METTVPTSMSDEGRSSSHGVFRPALAVWAGLALIAILNGGLRETLLVPALGERIAHVLSTAVLVTAVAIVATLFVARYARDAEKWTLLAVGALWTVMTLAFEFGFGHYVEGKSWDVLLADYDVLAGRVWFLVPLALFVTPLLAARYLRRRD